MRLASEPISPMYPEWRFVTDDAHGIGEAVRRHDAACRLAFNPDTKRFGLFRFATMEAIGSAWLCGRELRTIHGNVEPDRRVIAEMQEADMFRRLRPADFYRATQALLRVDEERKRAARREEWEDLAEPVGHAIRQEAGVKLKAFIPDNEATERIFEGG